MISVEAAIENRFPGLTKRRPMLGKTVLNCLKFLCHEREFKQFESTYPHIEGFDFVEQVLDYFDFSFRVLDSERARIPASGRVVIVANHPIGSLDGLALLKMVGEVRPDVKAIANDILYALKPLRSLLLPVDNNNNRTVKKNLLAIREHLDNEGAIIIFPAGEVSRMGPTGIKDGRWNTGFLRFAQNANAPILPFNVDGRNSLFFYSLSLLAKPISTLWLIREMFKQAQNHIDIRVGNLVYPEQYQSLGLKPAAVAKLFKRHVYQLPKKTNRRIGFIPEYEAVAHPEDRQRLKREIQQCESLGITFDGKQIFLYRYQTNSVVLREIGRLRELTFRAVKEGSGKRRDIDVYDSYYDHIILWDEQDLELVGAYRMVQSRKAIGRAAHTPALYSNTLFNFHEGFDQYLECGLELGRSFVQPQYWGKRSLDYLWQGIGAYLIVNPEIRYMFGPVTISHGYPEEAKDLLINFYTQYFGSKEILATSTNPYTPTSENIFPVNGDVDNYKAGFRELKEKMSELGVAVPTLFKQYTQLCEPGGTQFAAFNIDNDFADCIDGLVVVDLEKIKTDKRKRYMGQE